MQMMNEKQVLAFEHFGAELAKDYWRIMRKRMRPSGVVSVLVRTGNSKTKGERFHFYDIDMDGGIELVSEHSPKQP